jgi:hypothetical protein
MALIPGYPTNYLLEVQKGGKLDRAISLGYVISLTRVNIPAKSTTYTLGKLPVREHSGNRFQQWTIAGRSGLASRRQYKLDTVAGSGRTEDASEFGTGPELFRNLSQFLDKYEDDAAKYSGVPQRGEQVVTKRALLQRAQRTLSFAEQTHTVRLRQQEAERRQGVTDNEPRMVFRALNERLDVLVETLQFQWARVAGTSRHSYEWTLTLQGYGVAEALERPFGILGTIAEQTKAVAKMVDELSNSVALAEDALKQIDSTLDAFKEPLRSVSKLGGALESLGARTAAVANWPLEMATTWLKATEDANIGLYSIWEALPSSERTRTGPILQRVVRQLRDAGTAARVALVSTGNAKLARNWDASANTPSVRASYTSERMVVKTHPVKAGETLYDIAEQLADDRTRWVDLLTLNELYSPFLDPRGVVLQPGVQLIAPLPPDATLTDNEIEDLYGTDMRLDFQYTDEGLQVDLLAKGSDDIQLVSGPENLEQALTMRLLTRKGDNPSFPSLGLPQLVGESNNAEALGHFAAHVRTQLLSDPRIGKLRQLDLEDTGDGLVANAQLETVEGSSRVITVPAQR